MEGGTGAPLLPSAAGPRAAPLRCAPSELPGEPPCQDSSVQRGDGNGAGNARCEETAALSRMERPETGTCRDKGRSRRWKHIMDTFEGSELAPLCSQSKL